MKSIYLGWQFAPALADPGPAPPPATRAAIAGRPVTLDDTWIRAQHTIGRRLARPAAAGVTASALVVALVTVAWLTGLASGALAGTAAAAATAGGLRSARAIRRNHRAELATISAERERVAAIQAATASRMSASHRDHAIDYRTWQRRKAMFDRQPSWFPVALPEGIDRLDVAGGTLAGWSALVTTIGATHLSLGGEFTIVDLSGGAVAGDLIHLARRSRLKPLVWLLPADLPRLDLGASFSSPALADVLAQAAAEPGGDRARPGAGTDQDCAILDRVLGALGPGQGIAQLTAALRVLGEIGDPRADLRAGLLTADQFDRIGRLFGRAGAERVVVERAWALEARLRGLELLGTDPEPLAPSRLRVTAIDRRCPVAASRTLGTYLVAAMTQVLREAEPSRPRTPWHHTFCLLGAERLNADVTDRLTDVCEQTGTGLILACRTIPAAVRERLGRGNAATAFMRLGNGDEAKAASELIGTEHRFVISQLTDTAGTSLTDTWGDSYTSSTGTADSVSDSVSYGRSRGRSSGRSSSYQNGFAPFGDLSRSLTGDASYSASEQDSVSLTEGINSGTSWGVSTSRALGENTSSGRTAQRSREFLVEAEELQRLPLSAAIICYPAPAGRTVLLADTNPALIPAFGKAFGKDRPASKPPTTRGSRPD